MASTSGNEIQNMALFCDFENVAIGVRTEQHAKFDIRKVLERLLVKGDIVVKKAYCDWERYKDFKRGMHEAAFELIDIPKREDSGKNSADIRMVVDALDLCYTKAHVDAFVIISGDSDFSPLVSKLRENNKIVIGVGVRSSTADLLVGNCDEFIFYDDLVKAEEARKKASAKKVGEANAKKQQAKRSPDKKASADEPSVQDATDDARSLEAIELVVDTVEALMSEKDLDAVHASNVKLALKRRRPDFVESAFGYKAFGKILEDAEKRGLLEIHKQGQAMTVCLPRSQ
ncbi:MAG: NYN domain-containing protein [Rhodocyclaceae bacterium]|nr:NYN domain-containing protein [Rhodocyclaceae bacterium]